MWVMSFVDRDAMLLILIVQRSFCTVRHPFVCVCVMLLTLWVWFWNFFLLAQNSLSASTAMEYGVYHVRTEYLGGEVKGVISLLNFILLCYF